MKALATLMKRSRLVLGLYPHLRNALSGALALDDEALSLSDRVLCDLRAEVLPHRGETSDCVTAHRGPQQVTAHGVTSEGCSPPASPTSPFQVQLQMGPLAQGWTPWKPVT